MAVFRKTGSEKFKDRLAGVSKLTWVAVILVFLFIIAGAFTIGGTKSTGKSYFAEKDSTVIFYLDSPSSLDEIYINAGTIYTAVGSNAELKFRRSTIGAKGPSWTTSYLGSVSLGNIYSADGKGISDASYNWLKLFDVGESGNSISTSYKLIEITFPCDMIVNEILFLDESGKVIPVYTSKEDAETKITASYWQYYRDLFNANDKKEGIAYLTDSQDSLRTGKTAYSNFTQDEAYTLTQVDNLLLGKQIVEGTYIASSDFGPLAVLFPLLGVLLFGKSLFALRIFSVLFAAATIAVVYAFGKDLFKNDGFAFLFACLFALGGLALTIGRMALPYSMIAFFVLAAFHRMYRYYAVGISSEKPVKTACNVLFSGIFFALAFAADPKSLFSGIALLILFVFGMVRQAKAHAAERQAVRKEMSDKNAVEKNEDVLLRNIEVCEEKEKSLRSDYGYKNRIAVLFFLISFFVASILFVMLAAIPSYLSYVRLYEADPQSPALGIFRIVGKAIKDAFSLQNTTGFTAANAVSAFGWLIGLKGATVFSSSTETLYCAVNVQLNIAMMVSAFVGLIFTSVYAILYAATGKGKSAYASAYSAKILQMYFVLLLGLVSSLLSYAFIGNVSTVQSYLFHIFYLGFIPLMFYTAYVHDNSEKKTVLGIAMNSTLRVLTGVVALYIVIFALSVPMYFSIPIFPIAATLCFGWTTFVGNGYYRL